MRKKYVNIQISSIYNFSSVIRIKFVLLKTYRHLPHFQRTKKVSFQRIKYINSKHMSSIFLSRFGTKERQAQRAYRKYMAEKPSRDASNHNHSQGVKGP